MVYAAVLAAMAVGLLTRSAHLAAVFPGHGKVVLGLDDSWFHARRALYSFANFPHVLQFDWYLDYPRGAAAPCPPLFDWLIAAVARVFGHDVHTFETVAAWVSPVLGALLSLPAFWIGCSIAGAGLGVAAAWLGALLPSGIFVTVLGNCDTPAAVALIAACWLASSLREIGRSGRALALHALLHAAIIAAMLLTWSGSLLYLALGEGARLGAVVLLDGRPRRYLAVGASNLLAGVPILAWLLASRTPLGGPFTSQTLSWLHLIALASIALFSLGLASIEHRSPAESPATRSLRALLLAACLALPALLAPEIRGALMRGLGFLGKQDVWAGANPEQAPLFTSLPETLVRHATTRFGLFAYLVPLTPLIVGYHTWRAREERRQRLFVLLCWVSALGGLVLSQVRFGTDFTVPGAVAFLLALEAIRSMLLRRVPPRMATGAVVVLAALLLGPVWPWQAREWKRLAAAAQRHDVATPARTLTGLESVVRFAGQLRRLTPETSGFLDSEVRPEYGVLVPVSLGHLFTYVARRPVPANNLGPYLDSRRFLQALAFYSVPSAREGIQILEKLDVRYVVTAGQWPIHDTFADVLHWTNGSAGQVSRPTGRLRLIAEGPPGGRPLPYYARRGWPRGQPPYKLFELVKGAVLVAQAAPDALVEARIRLETLGGAVPYVVADVADETGVARLRVPYPSGGANRAHLPPGVVAAEGDWLVRTRGRQARVAVAESDVGEGRPVVVHWQPAAE